MPRGREPGCHQPGVREGFREEEVLKPRLDRGQTAARWGRGQGGGRGLVAVRAKLLSLGRDLKPAAVCARQRTSPDEREASEA